MEEGKFDLVFIVDGLYINEKLFLYFLNCFEFFIILLVFVFVIFYIGLVGILLILYSELFMVVR